MLRLSVLIVLLAYIEFDSYRQHHADLIDEQKLITYGQAIIVAQSMVDADEERLLLALSGTLADPDILVCGLRMLTASRFIGSD